MGLQARNTEPCENNLHVCVQESLTGFLAFAWFTFGLGSVKILVQLLYN